MEHAAIGLLPLFALCDRNDIGGLSTPLHPDTDKPQVFIHDGHPGGVGISEHGYEVIEDLWSATLEAVATCPCRSGCPSCIHSPKCGNNNHPLDKEVATLLLRDILGVGASRHVGFGGAHGPTVLLNARPGAVCRTDHSQNREQGDDGYQDIDLEHDGDRYDGEHDVAEAVRGLDYGLRRLLHVIAKVADQLPKSAKNPHHYSD